jgi:trans-2,3-dihydro-3-hydroxyanthranilate isomerase
MSKRYRFITADVFTDRMFGGNQLAVFTDARGLNDATMHAITREMNLSETVFVLPPETERGTRRLRIFTPGRELPFAGHPTVGTAFVLAAIGDLELDGELTLIVFEEGVGPVEVIIRAEDERPVFTQLSAAKLPEFGPPPPPPDVVASVLSLSADDLATNIGPPRACSCGVPFLFVTVRDLDALGRARVNIAEWQRHIADFWASELYVISHDAGDADIRARMFAPAMGIGEDPATGAAASALAGYLVEPNSAEGTRRWTIRQGVEMGRPSTIFLEADVAAGAISAVRVGGASVLVSEGQLTLPD